MLSPDQPVENEKLKSAFEQLARGELEAAEATLTSGLAEAELAGDATSQALFFSALGVLHRRRQDFAKAWKFYEKAEKLLPHDPSLKLIVARLLTEIFGHYPAAIRKCRQALEIARADPALRHQARIILGLAFFKQSEKQAALESLRETTTEDLPELPSAEFVDLSLVEQLLRKRVGVQECREFWEASWRLAEARGETAIAEVFKKGLESF